MLPDHLRQYGLHAEINTVYIDIHYALEIFLAGCQRAAVFEYAGIVDQHIDTAVFFDNGSGRVSPLFLLCHISLCKHGCYPVLRQFQGHLSKKAAETTGLRSGIALISGAGDKIAGCVGANVLKKGDMIFEAASYAGLSCLVDDFRPDYEQRYFDILDGAFPDDLYAHYYIPGSGITLNWFMDHFARKGEESLGEAFARMDAKVGQIPPGSEGLMAIGMMGGTAMPFDGALKGVWMGFNWVHREEHFYRALQESFSYAVSTAIDRINAKYPDCGQDTVKIIGGGARSRVWTQMLADVSQKTFERLDREDIALWGACLLAADGIGLFGDVRKAAEEHVHVKEVYRPNRELAGRYAELKEQYNRYAKELSPYCKALKS